MKIKGIKMRKVVYNACFGGFGLSKEAVLLGRKLSGDPKWGKAVLEGESYEDGSVCDFKYGHDPRVPRHDPILVQIVEQLGKAASGLYADLQIVEVEGKYRIEEYDGSECVMTPEDYKYIE